MRIVALFPILIGTSALAQECVVPSERLVGILDRSGTCAGIDKDFATKWQIAADCPAAPKPGHLLLGRCVADFVGTPAAAPNDIETRIERLENEIDRLRSK